MDRREANVREAVDLMVAVCNVCRKTTEPGPGGGMTRNERYVRIQLCPECRREEKDGGQVDCQGEHPVVTCVVKIPVRLTRTVLDRREANVREAVELAAVKCDVCGESTHAGKAVELAAATHDRDYFHIQLCPKCRRETEDKNGARVDYRSGRAWVKIPVRLTTWPG